MVGALSEPRSRDPSTALVAQLGRRRGGACCGERPWDTKSILGWLTSPAMRDCGRHDPAERRPHTLLICRRLRQVLDLARSHRGLAPERVRERPCAAGAALPSLTARAG